jgi:hypothetical protein
MMMMMIIIILIIIEGYAAEKNLAAGSIAWSATVVLL